MTLNSKIKLLLTFVFCDFGLWLPLQEWIAPISLELNQNNLHIKFLVLNVDFNNPGLEPLFKETCARGCSTAYICWTIFWLSLCRIFKIYFQLLFFFFARIFCRFVRIFHRVLPQSGGGRLLPSLPAPTPVLMAVGNSQHKKKTITAIKHNYSNERKTTKNIFNFICLLYTSDAADE